MKKMLLTVALSGLVFLAVAQFSFIKLADANPYIGYTRVPALAHPSITILSPAENKTVNNSNNLTITFKATIKLGSVNTYRIWSENHRLYPDPEPVDFNLCIESVRYKPSWQPNNITVLWYNYTDDITEYSGNMSLTGIPEGNQTVTIMVYGGGSCSNKMVLYYFYAVSYCTVGFTVDTVSPQVSILELDNKTFVEPEVPLSFTVNETASKITYCLDGQENVTISGNVTLTELVNGDHTVTVYATDPAGNLGASETIHFTMAEPEPFPVAPVAATSMASVAVVGVALLVYFKKRKH